MGIFRSKRILLSMYYVHIKSPGRRSDRQSSLAPQHGALLSLTDEVIFMAAECLAFVRNNRGCPSPQLVIAPPGASTTFLSTLNIDCSRLSATKSAYVQRHPMLVSGSNA